MTQYRLIFNGPIQQVPLNSLRQNITEALVKPDFENLTFVFSSDGGSVCEALNFCDFLCSLPLPISFHGAGHIKSSAIPIFLSAHVRTCTPNCQFLFHPFTYSFNMNQQTQEQVEEALHIINSDREKFKKIAQSKTIIPTKSLELFYARLASPSLVESEQAKNWGIVNDVFLLNPSGQPQTNVSVSTVIWNLMG